MVLAERRLHHLTAYAAAGVLVCIADRLGW